MISEKKDFIQKVLCLMCKKCARRVRIEARLNQELHDKDFDFEKDEIAARIINEEA